MSSATSNVPLQSSAASLESSRKRKRYSRKEEQRRQHALADIEWEETCARAIAEAKKAKREQLQRKLDESNEKNMISAKSIADDFKFRSAWLVGAYPDHKFDWRHTIQLLDGLVEYAQYARQKLLQMENEQKQIKKELSAL